MATVIVPSVYPTGSTLSITGQVVAGDGHVVGGVQGWQFGTPLVTQAVHPLGVPSAGQLGPVYISQAQIVPVGGLASPQAFGTLKTRVTVPVTGLGSAQQFPVPKIAQTVHVQGLDPYAIYNASITGQVISGDGHLVGGTYVGGVHFGLVTVYATVARSVTGIPSAAAFGTVTVYLHNTVPVLGIGSAQRFGLVTWKAGPVFWPVAGLGSEQAFGLVEAYVVYVRPEVCTDLDLAQLLCADLTLAAAGTTELVLATAGVTDLTLDELDCEDITLQPLVTR